MPKLALSKHLTVVCYQPTILDHTECSSRCSARLAALRAPQGPMLSRRIKAARERKEVRLPRRLTSQRRRKLRHRLAWRGPHGDLKLRREGGKSTTQQRGASVGARQGWPTLGLGSRWRTHEEGEGSGVASWIEGEGKGSRVRERRSKEEGSGLKLTAMD